MGATRTGFRRPLIGDTAEHLLDELNCDVLLSNPPPSAAIPDACRPATQESTGHSWHHLKEYADMNDIAIEALAPTDVAQVLRSGRVLLIDVREPQEYQQERIAGALLYPLSTFDNSALPRGEFPRVVFHCGSGKDH
jgi:hypothetical protein